ncbi:hypothetical protein Lser_V15G37543 [Lactuca serriola]
MVSQLLWPNPLRCPLSSLFPLFFFSGSIMSQGDTSIPKTNFQLAFIVSNIKNVIPLVLNQTNDHYASWVEFFNIHVCACNVKDHIDEEAAKPTDVDKTTWDHFDALVKQWIYSTISPELAHTIMKPVASALDLWKRLQENFPQ